MITKEQILNAINYPYIVNQCNANSNTNKLRKGQAVFLACYRLYGNVVEDVMHIDKVDCFYNNALISKFLDKLADRLNEQNKVERTSNLQ